MTDISARDSKGQRKKKNTKAYRMYILVTVGIIIGGILALGIGPLYIPPGEICKILIHKIPLLSDKIPKTWASQWSLLFAFRDFQGLFSYFGGC